MGARRSAGVAPCTPAPNGCEPLPGAACPEPSPLEECAQLLSLDMLVPADKFRALRRAHADGRQAGMWDALIRAAAANAIAPISGFRVGAVGVGASGAVYAGVNMEFPGVPLSASVHAEQFLVVNALQHGETALRYIAVSAAPCGHCRQFMAELNEVEELRISFGGTPPLSLDQLLPHRFRPSDLLGSGPGLRPLLSGNLKAGGPGSSSDPAPDEALAAVDSSLDPGVLELTQAALAAAARCHAPYSLCRSGVALRLGAELAGPAVSGGYVESVAYNPSLGPLQCALVCMRLRGHADWSRIEEVVLVEDRQASVSQEAVTAATLRAIAPRARLHIVHPR
ncbi:CDD1 [Auxenochlorella protothecoides x Auxenochlorella symbiontica]